MSMTHRHFNKETGIALVTISDKFGISKGRARVHDEDKELTSEFTGLTIAEMKARIERERKRKNIAKKELDKSIKQVKRISDHYGDRFNQYENLKAELQEYLDNKEEFRKTYRKLKAGKGRKPHKID